MIDTTENIRTFCSSEDSTTYRPDEGIKEKMTLNEQTPGHLNLKKEEEFFKPVDFDYLTASEKKSFHYDLKIFAKTKEDSLLFNSDTKEFPQNCKSFSCSILKRKESLSGQLNLGVDPFSSSLRGLTLEASYENSFFQNENIGEINVPNKKSFHFINKFSKKNSPREKMLCMADLANDKLAMGTSITEFGG